MTDPFAAMQSRVAVVAVLERIRIRASRGRELKKWGLNPQQVDPDSSLAADDAGFLTAIGGDYVRTTALYPIMSATDCLAAIAELVDGWDASNNSHMVSLLTLCRSAVETAAKTVWLLSETDRAGRQARCVGFTYSEMSKMRGLEPTVCHEGVAFGVVPAPPAANTLASRRFSGSARGIDVERGDACDGDGSRGASPTAATNPPFQGRKEQT